MAKKPKEKASFDEKKFHNKDGKFQKHHVSAINKGKQMRWVQIDKGTKYYWRSLIHEDRACLTAQTIRYKCNKVGARALCRKL